MPEPEENVVWVRDAVYAEDAQVWVFFTEPCLRTRSIYGIWVRPVENRTMSDYVGNLVVVRRTDVTRYTSDLDWGDAYYYEIADEYRG
jgi:hypothetical protein